MGKGRVQPLATAANVTEEEAETVKVTHEEEPPKKDRMLEKHVKSGVTSILEQRKQNGTV